MQHRLTRYSGFWLTTRLWKSPINGDANVENPNYGRLNYPLLKPHLLHKGNMVSFLLHNIGNGLLNSCLLYTIYYNCEIGTGNCTMDVRNDLARGTQIISSNWSVTQSNVTVYQLAFLTPGSSACRAFNLNWNFNSDKSTKMTKHVNDENLPGRDQTRS